MAFEFRTPGSLISPRLGDWRWLDDRLRPIYEAELFAVIEEPSIAKYVGAGTRATRYVGAQPDDTQLYVGAGMLFP
jgi:hypothetical protein